MDSISKTSPATVSRVKKGMARTRFFQHVGHDARHDWMFLLCVASLLAVACIAFAVWVFIRVQSGRVFSFDTEPVPAPSIVVSTDALNQTIQLFEKKKARFNSIRQIGVNASDPSL